MLKLDPTLTPPRTVSDAVGNVYVPAIALNTPEPSMLRLLPTFIAPKLEVVATGSCAVANNPLPESCGTPFAVADVVSAEVATAETSAADSVTFPFTGVFVFTLITSVVAP
jgi:hypothetical protein